MRSHLLIRTVTGAAVLVGVAGGAIAIASPANALHACGSGFEEMDYSVSSPPIAISVDDVIVFPSNHNCDVNVGVSVSKYIGNGSWQVVATGAGSLQYSCTGGRYLYTTSVTTEERKPAFYCG
jgi:hypothetical protein